jgi:hypothetical protein
LSSSKSSNCPPATGDASTAGPCSSCPASSSRGT